jgi:2-oxoisovalerate dehydrogenase E2 component (dihydrolipoyl transacylase)
MRVLTMPDVGESVTEGTVVRWLKHEGDAVSLDEPIVEIETEKVEVEVPSPYEGRMTKILVQEGAVAAVGAPLAEFETVAAGAAEQTANVKQQTANSKEQRATRGLGREGRYSPVVLKLAGEHGIDLSLVQGTGIEGRVTRQDVMRYLANPVAHTVPPPSEAGVVGAPALEPAAPPAAAVAPASDVVPLTPTRRTIAARMLESHRNVPVAWMAVEADVTELVRLREAAKEEFQRTEGVALTFLPFFIQAVVAALKEHPALNATFTDEGVRVHKSHDIGIAISADSGLIVPVIRAADGKSVAALAHELEDLGARARARKLRIEDVSGATFTVDNTGAFGSVLSQPIVPPGQVAIITTEAIRPEPRVTSEGTVVARSVMNLCISFDHRALDGAQAGAFMRVVKHNLESLHHDTFVY